MRDSIAGGNHLRTDAFAFEDAYSDHSFLCCNFFFISSGSAVCLDCDACIRALTASRGFTDLGYGEGDFDASAEAAHERAGLLFAKGSKCFGLAVEWVPALVKWRVDQSDLLYVTRTKHPNVEKVCWRRGDDPNWAVRRARAPPSPDQYW